MKRLGITITDKNLLKSDIKNLKKKLVDHGVLIIKKQKLNNKKLIKFSKLFGQPIVHNFSKTISKYPEIMTIIKEKKKKIKKCLEDFGIRTLHI